MKMEVEFVSKRPFFISDNKYFIVFETDGTDAQLGIKIEDGCFVPLSEVMQDSDLLAAFLSELPYFVLAMLKNDGEYIEMRPSVSLRLKSWVESKGGIQNVAFRDVLQLLRSSQ